MKINSFIGLVGMVAIAAVFTAMSAISSPTLSDIQRQNIEALASPSAAARGAIEATIKSTTFICCQESAVDCKTWLPCSDYETIKDN
jgi:hypothetical protein